MATSREPVFALPSRRGIPRGFAIVRRFENPAWQLSRRYVQVIWRRWFCLPIDSRDSVCTRIIQFMDKKYGWFNVEIIATNISSIFVFHQNKHFPWSLSLGLEVPRGDRFRARRRPRDLLLSILFLRSRTRPFSFFLSRESSWKTIIGHPTRENNNKRRLDSLCKFFDFLVLRVRMIVAYCDIY